MINQIENEIKRKSKRSTIDADVLFNKLVDITKMYEYINKPLVYDLYAWSPNDIPSSVRMNEFLYKIERDVNLIRNSQVELKSSMVSSWNVIEQKIPEIDGESDYDFDFTYNLPKISVFDNLVLGVNTFTDVMGSLSSVPVLQASSTNKWAEVFYGKKYGLWIENNEGSEDGVRIDSNDGNKIIDNKDTFWEVESTILQGEIDDSFYKQALRDEETKLSVTIRLNFAAPVSINTFTLIPHNYSKDTYYNLVSIITSDGIVRQPCKIKKTTITKETTFTFETKENVREMIVTLEQSKGYYEKYTMARYRLAGNESWADIMGEVTQRASSLHGDPNDNITKVVNDVPLWLKSWWLPGIGGDVQAKIDISKGKQGYLDVQSSESKRKRWAIGVTDIRVGYNEYQEKSEIVTKEIEVPDETKSIRVHSIYNKSEGTNIQFDLSFDNGLVWRRILSWGDDPIYIDSTDDEFGKHYVPCEIFINSDLSDRRQMNTITKKAGYIRDIANKVRLKIAFSRSTGNQTPSISDWRLEFIK